MGYGQNQFLKYLPYAIKAAKPYVKPAAKRNQLRKKKSKTRARGYAATSRRKYSKVVRNAQSIKKLQQHTGS